eukprot:15334998-Ditylum_brightwellii.AAC.1
MSLKDTRTGNVSTDGATGNTILKTGAQYRQQHSSWQKNTGYYTISSAARKSAAPGETQRNGHNNSKAQYDNFLLLW